MLIHEETQIHKGKIISHFEDEFGAELSKLFMVDTLVIVFTDGSKINMVQDWRGQECYWSQYKS